MSYQSKVTSQYPVLNRPGDTSPGPKKRAESKPSKRPKPGGLETTAKSVRQSEPRSSHPGGSGLEKAGGDGRADRFRWQRHAAKLMRGEGRVGLCRWSVVSKTAGVDMVSSSYSGGGDRVHYEGLQTCGSVWACPCCSFRISQTRKEEMNKLLRWARGQGLQLTMLTLTARHGRDDALDELLAGMKDAKQRWARHRAYRNLKPKMVGSVTATEVTGGGVHGWHPHFHVILVTEWDTDLSPLRDAWLASLRGAGLEGTGAGWDMRSANETAKYIAKWGAAEELALSGEKKGRSSMTPAQMLAASCDDGDRHAGMLWAEYASVFRGRRQLVWSRGLKALAEIDVVDDEEAAKDKAQDDQVETGRANIRHALWVEAVASRRGDRRSIVQERAEEVGVEQAIAEIEAGHIPDPDIIDDLIELIGDGYKPRPGGLAAAVLARVQQRKEMSDGNDDSTEEGEAAGTRQVDGLARDQSPRRSGARGGCASLRREPAAAGASDRSAPARSARPDRPGADGG